MTLTLTTLGFAPSAPATAAGTSNILLNGGVTVNGTAQAGVTVTAMLWPSPETLAALPDGAAVPMMTVTNTLTDSAGHYKIDLAPSAVPSSYLDVDGSVNIQVESTEGSIVGSWEIPAAPAPVGASNTWMTTMSTLGGLGYSTPDVSFGFDDGTGTVAVSDDSTAGSDVIADGDASSSSGTVANCCGTAPCTYVGTTATSNYKTDVGDHVVNAYGWSGGVVSDVKQWSGAGHTLGIAINNGTNNVWSAGGSAELSVTTAVEHHHTGLTNYAVYNGVNYREFELVRASCPSTYQWRPVSNYTAIDMAYTHTTPHYNYSYCTTETPGASWTKSSGGSYSFTTGVTLGGLLDTIGQSISLTAGSSWATESTVSWTVTKKSLYCGSSSLGPDSSTRVDVRQYPTGGCSAPVLAARVTRMTVITPNVFPC